VAIDHLSIAVAASEAAAQVIATNFRSESVTTSIREKAPNDWVTAIDIQAEAAAMSILRSATPEIPVVSEESGGEAAALYWLMDPVDGTVNYMSGYPMVATSIALVEGTTPLVGVVNAPVVGDRWTASRGGGAHDRAGKRLRLDQPRPGAPIAVNVAPHRDPSIRTVAAQLFAELIAEGQRVRAPGCASYDLAATAAGIWGGYVSSGLSPWDMAASALILREAGARFTSWDGDPDAWLETGTCVAGPPSWHAAMVSRLAAAQP